MKRFQILALWSVMLSVLVWSSDVYQELNKLKEKEEKIHEIVMSAECNVKNQMVYLKRIQAKKDSMQSELPKRPSNYMSDFKALFLSKISKKLSLIEKAQEIQAKTDLEEAEELMIQEVKKKADVIQAKERLKNLMELEAKIKAEVIQAKERLPEDDLEKLLSDMNKDYDTEVDFFDYYSDLEKDTLIYEAKEKIDIKMSEPFIGLKVPIKIITTANTEDGGDEVYSIKKGDYIRVELLTLSTYLYIKIQNSNGDVILDLKKKVTEIDVKEFEKWIREGKVEIKQNYSLASAFRTGEGKKYFFKEDKFPESYGLMNRLKTRHEDNTLKMSTGMTKFSDNIKRSADKVDNLFKI